MRRNAPLREKAAERQKETQPNYDRIKILFYDKLERTNQKHTQFECYLALNREYLVAEYLTTLTDTKLGKALTMNRLSEQSIAIERGRHRQTWRLREDRLCAHCPQNEVETELHLLTSWQVYDHIRDTYFPQIAQTHKDLKTNPILINSHIFWVKFHSVPSQQQYL